jgi:two-component system, cell cycle response regulator
VQYDTLMARVRSLVRLKRLLDEWRARGETVRALGLSADRAWVPSVTGARALVIDDWDPSAVAIQDALTLDGVVSSRARSRTEALALSTALPFDLLVLNMTMTTEDALKLTSILRAADATRDIPMLLIAEPEERDRLLRGFDLGANDWLLLPLDANELRARARNQIRRKFYQDRLRDDLGHALEMALTDPLTGLYNQRYLLRHLRGLLQNTPDYQVAVLMIDVDHFKQVNDQYGHATGDRVLREIADTLRANTRVFDSIARYGGEEFVVAMPGCGMDEAWSAAERVRAAVATMAFAPDANRACALSVSVGVACGGEQVSTPEALLHAADLALYAAKRGGRNRVELAGAA